MEHNSAPLNLRNSLRSGDFSTISRPQARAILSQTKKQTMKSKVCKVLLKKARADNKDPLLAFLDWRNTLTEGLGTSRVQRLMGRRTRTLLAAHTKLLEPKVDSQTEDKLAKRKATQEQRYNKKSQPLTPLQPGRAIRMKLPGDTKWSL